MCIESSNSVATSSDLIESAIYFVDIWSTQESGCADTNDMGHPAWTDVAEEGYEYNHSTFNDRKRCQCANTLFFLCNAGVAAIE